MIMKMLLHIRSSPSKVRSRRTSVVCSKYYLQILGRLGVTAIPGKSGYFSSHLSLEKVSQHLN